MKIRSRTAGTILTLALATSLVPALTACGAGDLTDPQLLAATTGLGQQTYGYSGAVVSYTVPDGVTSISIVAVGGSGGTAHALINGRSAGAGVQATVAVTPNQQLLISVGGQGASAGSGDSDPKGGWGGLGATGGNGNAAKDYLRTSGAGGGATTVQLTDTTGANPQTIVIAGGGGGNGGPSGDPEFQGLGGAAGCTDPSGSATPSWSGSNGTHGSDIKGGKGGAAAGETGVAGARGSGGSGLGGNGGGGGGGANGGAGGTGASLTSAGGGGGAGSSATFGVTNAAVTCQVNSNGWGTGDGSVILTPQPS